MEGSLSDQRRKNKQAEKELHHISEKLSHRLEELDQVLRRNGDLNSCFNGVQFQDEPLLCLDAETSSG